MVVIGVDLRESPEEVRRFREEFAISFPLLLDQDALVARAYGIRGHPTTFLIDRQGRLVGVVPGERDWRGEAVHRMVRRLLGDGAPAR